MSIFSKALDLDSDPPLTALKTRTKLLVYWALYTISFAVIFTIGFRVFLGNNLSFIVNGDGIDCTLVYIKYQSEYLRTIIGNILSGKFQIPMFDFRMGLGNDIFQGMVNGWPWEIFNSLSVFFPSRYEEFINATFVFRVYLAGLTFSILCIYARQKYWAIFLGALCYAFNICLVLDPYFPMVYTPLLFMGLDFILRKKKPFLFVLSVFFMALGGFYYLFMVTAFLAVYALIRVHHLYGKTFWKQLLPLALRAASSYILGLTMSAIVFLPTVLGYFDSSRIGRSGYIKTERDMAHNLLLFYKDAVIDKLFFPLTYNSLFLPSIVSIAVVLLFVNKNNKNDKRHLLAFFLFAFVVYITPLGNLFMNGFAYITRRWVFLFIFILCFITVYKLPQMLALKAKEKTAIIALIGLFGFYAITNNYYAQATVFFMLAFTAVCISTFRATSPPPPPPPTLFALSATKISMLSLVAIINLIVNTSLRSYDAHFSYAKNGSTNELYSELPNISESIKAKDDSFYRLDTPLLRYTNASLYLGYSGISVYLSIVNKYVTEALVELENISMQSTYRIFSFNSRTALNTLSSVKYYAEKGEGAIKIPFGYSLYDVDKTSLQNTYKNDYALPLGYTYDRSISYDEYGKLSALEKQEAMLQAVALDPEYANAKIDDLQFTAKEIHIDQYRLNGLAWDDGILTALTNEASLTLSFNGTENSETYIRLSGFYEADNATYHNIQFNNESLDILAPIYAQSLDRQGYYLYNCGYSEDGRTSATVVFRGGRYMLEDIKVYCYPMDSYPEQVMALKDEALENINVATNRVTGEISVSKDKYLVLSIPYSRGWSAKVDGNNAVLLRANTMFMALPLTTGNHTVELNYCTPGIRLGSLLSCMGFAMLICLWLLQRRLGKLQKE